MLGSPLFVERLVFEFKDALEKIGLIGQRERVRLLDRPFYCFVKRLVATRFAELDIDDFARRKLGDLENSLGIALNSRWEHGIAANLVADFPDVRIFATAAGAAGTAFGS